jgi:hypothetical protein
MVLPSISMGEVRRTLGSVAIALAIVACGTSGADPEAAGEDLDAEAARVPDPPPRYAKINVTDAAAADPDAEAVLQIKCGRDKPYVCALDDGTFACSSVPCLPDCTRIGCVGGDVCAACDGGYRCVAPGEGC